MIQNVPISVLPVNPGWKLFSSDLVGLFAWTQTHDSQHMVGLLNNREISSGCDAGAYLEPIVLLKLH